MPLRVSQGTESIELEISRSSEAGLFVWTLTHPSRAFTQITPVFNSQGQLIECTRMTLGNEARVSAASNYHDSSLEAKIIQVALAKIDREWRAWVQVHEELPFVEQKLDNMLMMAIYRIILDRDQKRCVLCCAARDLTIHHIIQKRRNVTKATPPFGRSVPTNLITLCRPCHAIYDPIVLS